ncbi:MAG: magnesium transporter [Caldilineaceae bacterium]|nr:magnesium transporter [Caldilineaceae bacterium]
MAAQGGNAGNQSMTIVVRSLALGEMELSDAWKALRHELTLGLIHGLLLGLTIGLIAWLWQGSAALGLIIFLAMVANLIISAVVGVLVPTTLQRLNVDPALASGVFVTATTDVMGFAIFLGLATLFLVSL